MLLLLVSSFSVAGNWPQEVPIDGGNIVVYQPQPEALERNTLTGRAAMSIEIDGQKDTIYGVFWFPSKIETDRGKDHVRISNVQVAKVAWPDSKDTDGPWTFVRSDKLPDGFREIPPASDIGGVKSSVAGTDEANEAIKATDVAYAINTQAQVVRIEGKFYAVDNGVWFSADAAEGPWIVADTIPSEKIAGIPPSSPGATPISGRSVKTTSGQT